MYLLHSGRVAPSLRLGILGADVLNEYDDMLANAAVQEYTPGPCPNCSLNAVTLFAGSGGTGRSWEVGPGQQHTNNDSVFSFFVPRGWYVNLVEDANYSQRHRKRQLPIYSPTRHQMVDRPHHVFWLWVEDRRTASERERDRVVGTLLRETALAQEEAAVAEQLRQAAARTAANLQEAENDQAARDVAVAEIERRQYEQELRREANMIEAQQTARMQAAGPNRMPWIIAGVGALIVGAMIMRRR